MPDFITVEDAVYYAQDAAAAREVPLDKSDFIAHILRSLKPVVAFGKNYYLLDDIKSFTQNFVKYAEEKDLLLLKRKRGLKVDREVDIIEFVESKEFMGLKGSIFPVVKQALWDQWHQKDRDYIEIVLTGCVSGDTQIRVSRNNKRVVPKQLCISDAYERTHHLTSKRKRWNEDVTSKLLCMKNRVVGFHDSLDIYYTGRNPLYQITTESGHSIKTTKDHKFLTPDGYVSLENLDYNSLVCVRAPYRHSSGDIIPPKRRFITSVRYHPFGMTSHSGGAKYPSSSINYKKITYAKAVYESNLNGLSLEDYVYILRNDAEGASKLMFVEEGWDIHHKDHNSANDSIDNLCVLPASDHDFLHGNMNVGNLPQMGLSFDRVSSIVSRGEDETFDVSMTDPHHNYVANRFIVHNSTFTGKSFMSEMNMAYMIYRLSILHDPQAEVNMAPGTPLYFVMQSGSLQQAARILFKPLYNRLRLTKYFTEVFPFNKDIGSELIFPNGIIVSPFSGSDDAVLGLTVLGGAVTELNRMAYVAKSRKNPRAKTSAEEQFYDQAVSIYTTLIRRMVGRTMQLGKLWGKLILDAAHEHEDDFTSRKIKEAQTNPRIYIYKKMQWEVSPDSKYSGEKFLVEIGNDTRRSRIINAMDESVEPEKVMSIPIEYKTYFEQDVEGSLRDFAGVVIGSQQPAIPYREKIQEGMDNFNKITGGQQLFLMNTAILQEFKLEYEPDDNWEALVNMNYVQNIVLDKKAEFVCHIDPGLKHDAMGIAIGHVSGYSLLPPVKRYNPRTKRYEEKRDIKAPMLTVDGILKVRAPYGEEVDLEMCQKLVLFLAATLNLTTVSIDSYQSAQMIQAWRTAGLVTGNVSVDDTSEPYTRVKIAYRDGRLFTPEHPVYKSEIIDLQWIDGKYDHLPTGSKDCSDAVAGVIYLLETHVADYLPESPHTQKSEVEPRKGERKGRWLGRPSYRRRITNI